MPVLRNNMRKNKKIEHGFDPIKTKRALERFQRKPTPAKAGVGTGFAFGIALAGC